MGLAERYRTVRRATEALAEPLSPEDCALQSMPDASPTKWHLAHTTWFFETLVLERHAPGFKPFEPHFRVLFNSYYNGIGEQYSRPHRGLLSRPGLEEVIAYRRAVDHAMVALLDAPGGDAPDLADVVELGLHHEQQHQELVLTDIKHALSLQPDEAGLPRGRRPRHVGRRRAEPPLVDAIRSGPPDASEHGGDGLRLRQRSGRPIACFVEAFEIASRPATNERVPRVHARTGATSGPSSGSRTAGPSARAEGWQRAALLASRAPKAAGSRSDARGASLPICAPTSPSAHVSYYEADAFATLGGGAASDRGGVGGRGRGTEPGRRGGRARRQLPGEMAWLHPGSARRMAARGPTALFGDLWEWTASAYSPYPGFRPLAGALGEYNGKFMSNQMVLRGGSCATPRSHIRRTYRNFFYPDARWQFSGIRLARNAA